MGSAAILAILPGPFIQTSFQLLSWRLNMKFGFGWPWVLKEIFKNGRQKDDDGQQRMPIL